MNVAASAVARSRSEAQKHVTGGTCNAYITDGGRKPYAAGNMRQIDRQQAFRGPEKRARRPSKSWLERGSKSQKARGGVTK